MKNKLANKATKWFKNTLQILFVIFVTLFCVANRGFIVLSFYPVAGSFQVRLFILFWLVFFVGMLTGMILSYLSGLKVSDKELSKSFEAEEK